MKKVGVLEKLFESNLDRNQMEHTRNVIWKNLLKGKQVFTWSIVMVLQHNSIDIGFNSY